MCLKSNEIKLASALMDRRFVDAVWESIILQTLQLFHFSFFCTILTKKRKPKLARAAAVHLTSQLFIPAVSAYMKGSR